MIAPILSKKGTNESGAFPKKRLTMNALHSLENRAHVLFAQRISCVCHDTPKAFHNTHTSETKSPEDKKEDDVFHRRPFMPADAHLLTA